MRFNSFLWNNFLESSDGRQWTTFFAGLKSRYLNDDCELKAFFGSWSADARLESHLTPDEHVAAVRDRLELLDAETDAMGGIQLGTWAEAEAFFRDEVCAWAYSIDESANEADFVFDATDIPELSVALYCNHPSFFFPYYFFPQFYKLQRIFEEFGIFLPPVPPARDREARLLYYLELCRSLHAFCAQYGIAPEHLPAFLYGFAPGVIGLNESKRDALPKPRRAWITGAGINNNGDFEYLDQIDSHAETFWTGNVGTEPGDIVILYCLAPRSHIHSIWRAIRPGAVEPFRYWPATIWIGDPIKIPPLPLSELKRDPIMSGMPLVRANMQGLNGRSVPKQYYDRMLMLLAEKGQDVGLLPQLEDAELPSAGFATERDVEERFLEPLLLELGFAENDWERQVSLRVGRGERAIPDYVLLPVRGQADRSIRAAWVWEAKLSVSNQQQIARDLGQAASYGRLVGAEGVGLISKEGVWISLRKHDYAFDRVRYWSAAQLRQASYLDELRELAGKRRLGRKVRA